MHARAARVLTEAGVSPAERAPHLLATDPVGDAGTVTALREAAAAALGQGAADAARRYLTRALAEPPGPAERSEVLSELGTAEWLAGEPASASNHLREAVEATADPQLRAERAVTLARAVFYTGQVPQAVDLLEREAEGLAGAEGEAIDRLHAEIFSLGIISELTIPRIAPRLDELEPPEGNDIGSLLTTAHLGAREWMVGVADRTVELCERAYAGGELLEREGMESIAIYEIAWSLIWADRQDLAGEIVHGLLEQSTAKGSVFGHSTARALGALLHYSTGNMTQVEAEARAGIELSEPPAFTRPPLYTLLAMALIERGAYDEAEEAVRESGCGPFLPPMLHMHMAFQARGRLRLAQGKTEDALADFLELGDRYRLCDAVNPSFTWRRGAAEAHVKMGNPGAALRLAEEQIEVAERWGTKSAMGIALHVKGIAREAEGAETLSDAAEILADSPARIDEARVLIDLGRAMRRGGMRAQARDPLRKGLELARGCGATVLAERAHEELITAGARPRRLMFSGVESLTASERRVAELAAQGSSNREIAEQLFVTVKTVENHLTRVYSKLDVGSRDGLPDALFAPAGD
jgi:ATP/maltotriose-dependent transcriptional regulator MalT